MRKSILFVLWCLLVSIFALTACGSKDVDNKSKKYSLAFNDLEEHWAYQYHTQKTLASMHMNIDEEN